MGVIITLSVHYCHVWKTQIIQLLVIIVYFLGYFHTCLVRIMMLSELCTGTYAVGVVDCRIWRLKSRLLSAGMLCCLLRYKLPLFRRNLIPLSSVSKGEPSRQLPYEVRMRLLAWLTIRLWRLNSTLLRSVVRDSSLVTGCLRPERSQQKGSACVEQQI
jgi:hypothetical protein